MGEMQMKVLLINGSPHEKGCTYTALKEAADALTKQGVGADFLWIGNEPMSGCIACGNCGRAGKCVFDDKVNVFLDIANDYDGFIFGSPVYYGSMNGAMSSFMDRIFYADLCSKRRCFYLKPAAAVISARRAGTTASLDQLNKYFTISQMPVISSTYWNMVHGSTPEEVKQDLEGLQTIRMLGKNMAWFLKIKEAGDNAAIPFPEPERTIRTNFIR